MKHIELWHGGRNLESGYRDFVGAKKGRWEYGPGLYVTTHYERARDYAKSGGKTYLVTIEEGQEIDHVKINIAHVNDFVSRHVIKNKQKDLLDEIYSNMQRMKTPDSICANHFLNLVMLDDRIKNTKTAELNHFLVEQGVDYGIGTYFGGRNETVMVIFNRDKIKKVKAVPAKDVELTEHEKEFVFNDVENVNGLAKMKF